MRSIGTKLFLAVLAMIGLFSACLGTFSYFAAKNAIVGQAEDSAVRMVSLAGEKLDMKLRFYLDAANPVVTNRDFQEQLLQLANASSMPEDELARRRSELLGMLDQFKLSDSAIRDVSLLPLSDPIRLISTDREAGMPDAGEDWIRRISEAAGKPVWLSMEPTGYLGESPRPLFAYGKWLGKTNIGSNDYILLVQIEYAALQKMVEDVKLGEASAAFLFEGSGQTGVLAQAGPASLTPLIADASAGPGARIEGGDRLAAYRTSAVTGRTLAPVVPLSELIGGAERIRMMTIAAVTVSIAIAAMVALGLASRISKPLNRMKELMRQASEGDLQVRMPIGRSDEIGELSAAFNRMAGQIGALVSGARKSAAEVDRASARVALAAKRTEVASADIYAAASQIAQGAEELAANADRSGGSVSEMGLKVAEAGELHSGIERSAKHAEERSNEGVVVADSLLARTKETDGRITVLADRVNGLSEVAASLGEVLQLIGGMAKRTGILSLNAGIEAARGGQASGGFKVIAGEIRLLAEQSDASLKQAGAAADRIRAEVDSAVGAMRETTGYFREMFDDVTAAHRLFREVREALETLKERLQEANRSLHSLHCEHGTLHAAIEEVTAVSEEASASTEQVREQINDQHRVGKELVELSEELRQLSSQLAQRMSGFLV